jgi:hypothetical protein
MDASKAPYGNPSTAPWNRSYKSKRVPWNGYGHWMYFAKHEACIPSPGRIQRSGLPLSENVAAFHLNRTGTPKVPAVKELRG